MKNIVGIDNWLDTMDTEELRNWLHDEDQSRYAGTILGYICDMRNKITTLTEQLRLANEDAERLAEYAGHKRTCTWAVVRSDVTPKCDCNLSDVMYLHKERIEKG